MRNPFDPDRDPERHHIWQRLIFADSQAFAAGDWEMIADDFDAEHFEGIRCGLSSNPDDWHIAFATLEAYRDQWLAASREFRAKRFVGLTPLDALLRRCRIDRIDIAGDRAIAHKRFSGAVPLVDGSALSGSRQTLYRLHRRPNGWKIVGFLGQLPLEEP